LDRDQDGKLKYTMSYPISKSHTFLNGPLEKVEFIIDKLRMKNRRLVFVGDIHGEFREMIWKATQQYDIRGADLVVLGDFGVGFDGRLKYDYGRALKKMEEHDIEVYTIRGNHDDPDFFKDDDTSNFITEDENEIISIYRDFQSNEREHFKQYTLWYKSFVNENSNKQNE
jgi:metallophosphoesterase superfamily enzyme